MMLIAIVLKQIDQTLGLVCPPNDLIAPCKCANYLNLIECSNITDDGSLRRIFQNLRQELDRDNSRLIYDEFKLVQSQLEIIGGEKKAEKPSPSSNDDIFAGIGFRRISLNRNSRLKRIEPETFASSFNITNEIIIEDNELLGQDRDDCVVLFDGLNRFTGLNTLHLTDNGVSVIPENAFNRQQPALRELFLTDNRIERIENNAFIGLSSLQMINLDGNLIEHLASRSLELPVDDQNESTDRLRFEQKPLKLFLRSNRLQTDSFPLTIFASLQRRSYLNLNLNNLTKLPQIIFQSFFKHRSLLSIAKNPLQCDCDFLWMMEQNFLYNSSDPKRDYLLRDYQCMIGIDDDGNQELIEEVNRNDFEHCPSEANNRPFRDCITKASNRFEEIECIESYRSQFSYNHKPRYKSTQLNRSIPKYYLDSPLIFILIIVIVQFYCHFHLCSFQCCQSLSLTATMVCLGSRKF